MSEHIETPWTPEQVKSLNDWQRSGSFHPFTCGNNRTDEAHTKYQKEHGGDFGELVATSFGWICPVCGYKQGWAHDFMANDSWREEAEQNEKLLKTMKKECP